MIRGVLTFPIYGGMRSENISKRDQLSFNYSIWNKNVIIDVLNPNINSQ